MRYSFLDFSPNSRSELTEPLLRLNDFELKAKFLAPENCRQVELPEFSGETKARPAGVEVDEELDSDCPP